MESMVRKVQKVLLEQMDHLDQQELTQLFLVQPVL
jgi:hypothetical protein